MNQIKTGRFLLLTIAAALLVGCGLLVYSQVRLKFTDGNGVAVLSTKDTEFTTTWRHLLSVPDTSKQTVVIDGRPLEVEVVNTGESITQGLSNRSNIGADGMLFVFPTAVQTSFWMKEMQFDLDIVWLSKGFVVGIEREVPHPKLSTPIFSLESYRSPQDIELVLELPAGEAQRLGINDGSKLILYE